MATFFFKKMATTCSPIAKLLFHDQRQLGMKKKKKEAVATIEDKIENKTFQVGMFVVSYRNSLKMNSNSMELCVGVVREGKLHFPLLK